MVGRVLVGQRASAARHARRASAPGSDGGVERAVPSTTSRRARATPAGPGCSTSRGAARGSRRTAARRRSGRAGSGRGRSAPAAAGGRARARIASRRRRLARRRGRRELARAERERRVASGRRAVRERAVERAAPEPDPEAERAATSPAPRSWSRRAVEAMHPSSVRARGGAREDRGRRYEDFVKPAAPATAR